MRPWIARLGCIAVSAGSGIGCDRHDAEPQSDTGAPVSVPATEPEPVVAPPVAERSPLPALQPHGFAVVRDGADLRPGTDANAKPLRVTTAHGTGLDVTAVGVKDALVVVESGGPGDLRCAGELDALGDFRLEWLVSSDDLASVVAKRITVPFADGTKVELLAGVPLVREGEAWIADALGVRVRVILPEGVVDRFYAPGDREPTAARTDPDGLRQSGGALVYDGGRVLEGVDQLKSLPGVTPRIATFGQRTIDGRTLVDVRARCIAATVEAPSDRLAPAEDLGGAALYGTIGMLGGGSHGAAAFAGLLDAPAGPRWQVEPGAAIHDAGRAIVGQVEATHVFEAAPIDRDARRCFAVTVFESSLELCFAPTDVHELPGSSAAPTELGIAGLDLGAELGGAVGGTIGEDPGVGLGAVPGGLGAAPSAKPKKAKVRGGSKAEVTGSLAPEIVRRHMKGHVGEVRRCYEKALVGDPALVGKLTLTFTIRPDGTVSSSRISASTMPGDEVGDCLVAASKRWTFPAPEGGGAVVVNYPFVFASSP